MSLNLLRANQDGLLQLFTEFLEPEIHILTATDITNGYVEFTREPITPSGVLLFVDQAIQYNKAWTLGSLIPNYEMDATNKKRCYFKNEDGHTGLNSPYDAQEGMVFIAFFKAKEDGDVLKLDSKPKSTVGYDQNNEELLIDAWLEVQGEIIRDPDSCTVIFYDNEETVYVNASSTTNVDGTFRFAEFESLGSDKIYTLEVQIVKNSISYESRIPVGILDRITVTIPPGIGGDIDSDFIDFQGYVWIDETSGQSGIDHPVGTVLIPSNNLPEALQICKRFNFKELLIRNMVQTLSSGLSISKFLIKARSPHHATLILDGGNVSGAHFKYLSITGEVTARINAEECILYDIQNFEGTAKYCLLDDVISLGNSTPIMLLDCYSENCNSIPVIDFQGNDVNLVVRGFSGYLKLRNKTGSKPVCIDLISGTVEVESSCTGKNITIRGASSIIDTNNHSINEDTTLENIISIGDSTLENLKDVRGLLNENVKQVVTYDANGQIESVQSVQYEDNSLVTVRKSWTRQSIDREGRRVKDTSKVED